MYSASMIHFSAVRVGCSWPSGPPVPNGVVGPERAEPVLKLLPGRLALPPAAPTDAPPSRTMLPPVPPPDEVPFEFELEIDGGMIIPDTDDIPAVHECCAMIYATRAFNHDMVGSFI